MSKLRHREPQTATPRCHKTTRGTFVLPAALMNASSSPRRWLSAPERLLRRLSRSSRDHTLIVITRSINLHSTAPSSPLHQLNTLNQGIKHWEFSGWYEWSSCRASGTHGNEDEIGSACQQLTPAGRQRDLQPHGLPAAAGAPTWASRPLNQLCLPSHQTGTHLTRLEDAGKIRKGPCGCGNYTAATSMIAASTDALCLFGLFRCLAHVMALVCDVFICKSAEVAQCFGKKKQTPTTTVWVNWVISLERESNGTTLVCAKCPEAVTRLSCLHCSALENKQMWVAVNCR